MSIIKQTRVLSAIVGSYPKPSYILPDQNNRQLIDDSGRYFYDLKEEIGEVEFNKLLDKATDEAIADQEEAGLDIVADGEERREHYVLYNLRHLDGVDFTMWKEIEIRGGAYKRMAPTVNGQIRYRAPWLVGDFEYLKSRTGKIAKMTLPGPTTAVDVMYDEYYGGDRQAMAVDYARAIRVEVGKLIEAGCEMIQFDDPMLLRDPNRAKAWGLRELENCFSGLENRANFGVHICRGYPNKPLEEKGINYKGNAGYYEQILSFFSNSNIDYVSIEGAQSKLDLSVLSAIGSKSVMLGVIDVGSHNIESVGGLVARGKEALRYIKPEQLILGTDCGLIMIPKEVALQKMVNLALATKIINQEI